VSTASNNFVNYSSEEFDSLYEKAQQELDEEKRASLYKDLQRLLSEDAASVYIQDITLYYVLRGEFEGYESYPLYVSDYSLLRKAR
jgi:peptide/nickel transport system substrate-binding protein